ncbi:hypothetical protein [Gorillibacterium sp. CAU 1737]|uniref:hypothetical protein n=1 Tax=Gorillibacterium sp. CAU 1737 TaxID=3140362 RepID=UPI0032617CB2
MDKRLIISAYRQGRLTRKQCAQLLGIESESLVGLLSDERSLRKQGFEIVLHALAEVRESEDTKWREYPRPLSL